MIFDSSMTTARNVPGLPPSTDAFTSPTAQNLPMGLIRVVLADNHQVFMEALAIRLRTEPGIEVMLATTDVEKALGVAAQGQVDVALLDVALNANDDGIELGRKMRQLDPRIRLVAITCADEVEVVARGVRAGFLAWVPKDVGVHVLLDVIHAVCRDETWITGALLTKVVRHLVVENQKRDDSRECLAALTSRELDVLRRMATGAGRAEIAQQLFISPNTVRTHMQSILAKLGVHSSLAAVASARRAGVT